MNVEWKRITHDEIVAVVNGVVVGKVYTLWAHEHFPALYMEDYPPAWLSKQLALSDAKREVERVLGLCGMIVDVLRMEILK